jgi:hypothetical protein
VKSAGGNNWRCRHNNMYSARLVAGCEVWRNFLFRRLRPFPPPLSSSSFLLLLLLNHTQLRCLVRLVCVTVPRRWHRAPLPASPQPPWFIRAFVRSFVHSFVCSLHSCVRSFVRSFISPSGRSRAVRSSMAHAPSSSFLLTPSCAALCDSRASLCVAVGTARRCWRRRNRQGSFVHSFVRSFVHSCSLHSCIR